MVYIIGDYEIQTDSRELLYQGCSKKIEPLIFKLLTFMLENPERVLSRSELIKKVWESHVISDSALSATICAARHAIGDTAKKQKHIKTVSGSGYRFVADFSSIKSNDSQFKINTNENEKATQVLEIPDKPSIAIMDFVDISSSEEGKLLAYGLTTEINSSLARLPHFFVIARTSSSGLSKLNLSPREIGKRLGVRYLVYGSIEHASKRIRVTFSIIDALQDNEIWSEHFDRSLNDIFQVQDDISNDIIAATDIAIEQAEIDRAFLIPTEDLSAWENYHRGLWYIDRTTIKDVEIAQNFFKNAIKQDKRFSRAYAGLSYTHTNHRLLVHSTIKKTDKDIIKSMDYAQRSIDCCKHESMGYMSLGRVNLFANKAVQALPILQQAIDLCPNGIHSHVIKGHATSRLGYEYAVTNQLLEQSERLNPLCSTNNFTINMVRAMSLVNEKKYDEAVNAIVRSTHFNDTYFMIYAIASGCHQLSGKTQKAQQYSAQALKLFPYCNIGSFQHILPYAKEPRDRFVKALVDAGIPKLH